MKIISRETAGKIWEVLVQYVGAYDSKRERKAFVMSIETESKTTTCTEYRFEGSLGFGGKFRNLGRPWYVDCYQEDLTPMREHAIKLANEKLLALYETCPSEG